MSEERIYVGSGVEKFEGNLVNVSVCLTDIKSNAEEHIFEYNGKKYIKLKVQKKKDGADDYGKTHFVEVDTFKPDPKKNGQAQSKPKVSQKAMDDLPF